MKNPEQISKISIFKGKKIRKTIHQNKWYFVIVDVVFALTDSIDPSGYIKDMRRRDGELSKGRGQIATPPLQLKQKAEFNKLIALTPKEFFASFNQFHHQKPSLSSDGWQRLDMKGCKKLKTQKFPPKEPAHFTN